MVRTQNPKKPRPNKVIKKSKKKKKKNSKSKKADKKSKLESLEPVKNMCITLQQNDIFGSKDHISSYLERVKSQNIIEESFLVGLTKRIINQKKCIVQDVCKTSRYSSIISALFYNSYFSNRKPIVIVTNSGGSKKWLQSILPFLDTKSLKVVEKNVQMKHRYVYGDYKESLFLKCQTSNSETVKSHLSQPVK